MSKRLIYLISFVLVLSLVGDVQAADVNWTDAGPDHLWSTPTNWASGTLPTSADLAKIGTLPCPGPTIANEGAVARQIQVSDGSSTTTSALTVDGGTLTTIKVLQVGQEEGTNGTLIMHSGTIP